MPVFQANTVSVTAGKYPNGAIWQSPDGQRSMWEISMSTPNGQAAPGLKTYSDAIAKVGFSGQIETYEKQGRNGIETFVRQYQDQSVPQSSGGVQRPYSPAPSAQAAPQQDNTAVLITCAKDVVVALIAQGKPVQGEYHSYLLQAMGMEQRDATSPTSASLAEPNKDELTAIFGATDEMVDDGSAPTPWANQSQ